jgi:hypothetical protein
MTDSELYKLAAGFNPAMEAGEAPRAELRRREAIRSFFRKDIVAWIALVISIFSLLVAFLKK